MSRSKRNRIVASVAVCCAASSMRGLLMPYRIVTTGRGSVREDLRFDEILVNPELARGDFGK